MKLKRKISNRKQRIKIYIFSEGKNTEPVYFKSYERYAGNARVELSCERERGVPTTLLKLAQEQSNLINSKAYIRENGNNDQVWIVFDRDEHHDINHVLDTCSQIGINVAFSNPCFEVWLILHICDYDKDEHRNKTQLFCEAICEGYKRDKRKLPDMSKLMPNVLMAENRALSLIRRRSEDGADAPYTDVYKLTRAIRGDDIERNSQKS